MQTIYFGIYQTRSIRQVYLDKENGRIYENPEKGCNYHLVNGNVIDSRDMLVARLNHYGVDQEYCVGENLILVDNWLTNKLIHNKEPIYVVWDTGSIEELRLHFEKLYRLIGKDYTLFSNNENPTFDKWSVSFGGNYFLTKSKEIAGQISETIKMIKKG